MLKEKIEQLKKELIVNPEWDIIEDEGEFYIVDMYKKKYRIDVELREKLPMSYFHSPECDDDIVGYNPFNGSLIYDLWKVGKTEMMMSEGIYSDFHDTGYGIGKLLSREKEFDFGEKVPPTHILPTNFINYQTRLKGSMNAWGYDIEIIKPNISELEQSRFDIRERIEQQEHFLELISDKPEDYRNIYIKILEDLKKEYDALG